MRGERTQFSLGEGPFVRLGATEPGDTISTWFRDIISPCFADHIGLADLSTDMKEKAKARLRELAPPPRGQTEPGGGIHAT